MNDAPSWPAGYRVVEFASVDSTNEEVLRRIRVGEGEGLVVVARTQTAGRGRRGRAWHSFEGNLHMSVLIGGLSADRVAEYSFVAGLALCSTIRARAPAGAIVGNKWPNDVLVNGAKVGGILIEAGTDPTRIAIGMGVNLRHAPSGLEFPATALEAEGFTPLDPLILAREIVAALEHWRGQHANEGFAAVRDAWLAGAAGVGREVSVRLPATTVTGVFVDIDHQGALRLRESGGTVRRITAADLFIAPA